MHRVPFEGSVLKRIVVAAILASALAAVGARAANEPMLLPFGWRLQPPETAPATLGTMPEGMVLAHDGKRAFIVESGFSTPGLRVVDLDTMSVVRFIGLKGAFGRPILDRTGDGVWVSGGSADSLFHIDAALGKIDRTIALPSGFYSSGIDRSADGKTLGVAGIGTGGVVFVDIVKGTVSKPLDVGGHPGGVAFSGSGTLYVTEWSQHEVAAIDVPSRTVRARIAVGMHPEALVAAGPRLYVADADDDDVSVIDLASDHRIAQIPLGITEGHVVGLSPNSVRVSPDGARVYVTCGAGNALAVLAPTSDGARVLGAIPTGWYPTDSALGGGSLYVLDGKGESSHSNPNFQPFGRHEASTGYTPDSLRGSLRRIPIPSDTALHEGVQLVREDMHESDVPQPRASESPGPQFVRPTGPIKHVIYVIKENRTYDQVLGDIAGANGDPHLAMFGERITPNQHALARRFGTFDAYFTNSHVSADGHNWSMAAFANDYLEKFWPPNYAGRRKLYDFEDGAEGSVPHNGYLWDLAARSGVSVRNYGEFMSEPKDPGGDATTTFPALRAVTDPKFPTFDMSIRDNARIDEWQNEFRRYVRDDDLPQLEIVRLPRDHTSGTRVGAVTPQGMVAENDAAVGRLVDIVSHSKYWGSTAIFIIEDDAQNGPDHVDDQRSTLYVVSAYSRPGIHRERYAQAGVVRTIETLLGMAPLTPYDQNARVLDAALGGSADLRPFPAIRPLVDTEARNTAHAYRAKDSNRMDFSHADAAPEAELNDILWGATHTAQR